MKSFVIKAFYKFVTLPMYESLKTPLLQLMKEQDIKGTLILAEEGINGTFCGPADGVDKFCHYLHQIPGLEDLSFHTSFDEANPFEKAKVKFRPEIVTMGEAQVSPEDLTGIHLSPEEWNKLLADPNLVLIDTRNSYEVSLGTFQGAINPNTENFRDFPEYVKTHLLSQKDKKIAMFCTGGIRCEKSTAYLKKLGFDEVYQLKGGILNYLETIAEKDSLWEGSCFVFDERVALDATLNSLPKGSIDKEWKNNSKKKIA